MQRYLPGVLPAAYPPIPVRTLLDHTSGLPHVDIPCLADPQWVVDHRFDRWTPRQVLDTATQHPHLFTPGSKQMYSNTSYVVAGMLVEKVTHKSYNSALQERIARPLGLCDTLPPNPSARGYITVNDKLVDVTEMNQSIPGAAGGMISSAKDLNGFITGLFRGRLLGPEMMERLFTVPDVQLLEGGPAMYSQGLMRVSMNGITLWGKTGSRYGYSSGVFATRGLGRKLVYSVNATGKRSTGQPARVQQIAGAATS